MRTVSTGTSVTVGATNGAESAVTTAARVLSAGGLDVSRAQEASSASNGRERRVVTAGPSEESDNGVSRRPSGAATVEAYRHGSWRQSTFQVRLSSQTLQSDSPVRLSGSSAALWFATARCRRRPRRAPTSARRAPRVRTHGHGYWRAGCAAQRTQYRHDGDRDTGPDQNAAQLAKCVDHRPVPRCLTCVLGAASEASSSSMSTGPGSPGFHREMEIQLGCAALRPRSPASRAPVNGRRRDRHHAGVRCWPRSTNAITSCRADSRANGFAGPGFSACSRSSNLDSGERARHVYNLSEGDGFLSRWHGVRPLSPGDAAIDARHVMPCDDSKSERRASSVCTAPPTG